jgi:hypothetical protein
MNNWQPINTAPKDRRILLAYKNKTVESGFYDDRYNLFVCDSNWNTNRAQVKASQPIAWQELPKFDGVEV